MVDHDGLFGKGGMASSDICGAIVNLFHFNIAISSAYGIEFYIGDAKSDDVTFVRHIGAHFEPVRLIMLAKKLEDQDALVAALSLKNFTVAQIAREYQLSTGSPIVTTRPLSEYIKSLKPRFECEAVKSEEPPVIYNCEEWEKQPILNVPGHVTPQSNFGFDSEDDTSLFSSFLSDSLVSSLNTLEDKFLSMQSILTRLISDGEEMELRLKFLRGEDPKPQRTNSMPHLGEMVKEPLRISTVSIPCAMLKSCEVNIGEMVKEPLRAPSVASLPYALKHDIEAPRVALRAIPPPPTAVPKWVEVKIPLIELTKNPLPVEVVKGEITPEVPIIMGGPFDAFVTQADDLIARLNAEIAQSLVEKKLLEPKTGEDKKLVLTPPGGPEQSKNCIRSKGFPQISKNARLQKDLLQDASQLYETHPIGRFFPDKNVTKQIPVGFDAEGKCNKTKNIVVPHTRAVPELLCSSYGYNYMQLDPETQSGLPVKIVDLGTFSTMHEKILEKMGDDAQFVDVGAYAYAKTQMIGKPINLQNKSLIARHVSNYFAKFDTKMITPIQSYLINEHTVTAVMHINDVEIKTMKSLGKTKNLKNVSKMCEMNKGLNRKTFLGVPLPKFDFKIIRNLSYPVKIDK
jgi:hypothetical protein